MNCNELKGERLDLFRKADALVQAAKKDSKDLSADDLSMFNSYVARMKEIDGLLDRSDSLVAAKDARDRSYPALPTGQTRPTIVGLAGHFGAGEHPTNNGFFCREVEQFITHGVIDSPIRASLQEGSDLAVSIPPYALENFRIYAPQLTPFENAGATVFNTDTFAAGKTKIPFVLPGATAGTFSEGAGPTVVQDASVKGVELTPAKFAFLSKMSEESDADMPDLGRALLLEGLSRIYASTEAAATAALRTSLAAATATVSVGTDNLESLLDLEAAITPTHASPSNVLMLSRSSLSRLRNTRDGQDRPIFDPINKTMLGYKTVLNDALDVTDHHYIVFGNWTAGAFISYSQFLVLRLLEAYREAGMIGLRFARRMASAFFSDASNGADQPLRMMDLGA